MRNFMRFLWFALFANLFLSACIIIGEQNRYAETICARAEATHHTVAALYNHDRCVRENFWNPEDDR
jgi:hypothetical protein